MIKGLASLTVAFNEEELIGGCLSLLNVEFKLVILPNYTFSGTKITERDNTAKIALDNGAIVLYTDLTKEYENRNYGLKFLRGLGYEYSLIVDADEYWPLHTQRLMKFITDDYPFNSYKAKLDFFFKRPNWKIEGNHNNAIVAISTNERFSKSRPRRCNKALSIYPGTIYHFAYVRSPEKIKEKLTSFSHSHEILEGWYENVYLPFTPESKNFHPVRPEEYPICRIIELPEEIKTKIPEHLWSV